MSGFFRGPSLIGHVLFAAFVLGFTGPFIIDLMPSRQLGLALILAIAAIYFLLAFIWASRHKLFYRGRFQRQANQNDSRDGTKP